MPEPSKLAAVKAETIDAKLTFTFDGEKYVITTPKKWDIEVTEAFEDGKAVSAARTILGPEQWSRFKSKPRNTEDLGALYDAMTPVLGIEGN